MLTVTRCILTHREGERHVTTDRQALRRRVADLWRAHPELPLRDIVRLARLERTPGISETAP